MKEEGERETRAAVRSMVSATDRVWGFGSDDDAPADDDDDDDDDADDADEDDDECACACDCDCFSSRLAVVAILKNAAHGAICTKSSNACISINPNTPPMAATPITTGAGGRSGGCLRARRAA